MNTNISSIYPNISIGTYIFITIYSLSVIISILICLIIISFIYITPTLHSSINLLISNTCLCTIIYSSISTINTFFLYIETISTDWSCRIRGYLTYVSINLVIYSYVIQTISRLFWIVLYKYRYLLTIKFHLYLIIFQILFSFIFPLSCLITTNIIFRSLKLCLVPIQYRIHVLYLLNISYIIPILCIIFLYIKIYHYTRNSSLNIRRLSHGTKRDIELARNILILLSIFLFGGVPTFLYVILSYYIESLPTPFYLFSIITPIISINIEKIMTIIFNKDIRKIIKQRWITYYTTYLSSSTHVLPFSSSDNKNKRIIRTISKVSPNPNAPENQQKESNL